MAQMQRDIVDLYYQFITPYLKKILLNHINHHSPQFLSQNNQIQIFKQIVSLLDGWTGEMDMKILQPLIVFEWERNLKESFFLDPQLQMSKTARAQIINNQTFDQFLIGHIQRLSENLQNEETIFRNVCINNENHNLSHPCLFNLLNAFHQSWDNLSKQYGTNAEKWNWGEAHHQQIIHVPMSSTFLKSLYHRSYPISGNFRTLFLTKGSLSKSKHDAYE